MMTENDYQHFVCIVAGDNPDTLMKEFDKNNEITPKILYRYSDANKLRKSFILEYEKALKEAKEVNSNYIEDIEDIIDELKSMTDEEYYEELLHKDKNYYLDENNGNIMTNKNIYGKFSYYNIGKMFSVPFITKDGLETYQCKKNEIDWNIVHMSGGAVYSKVWEMVMEKVPPKDEHEEILYNNMKDNVEYLRKFETKENYIASNTAFWGYAFLSKETGWSEISYSDDQFEWMKNYYNVFIKSLPEDTLLTIYECKK